MAFWESYKVDFLTQEPLPHNKFKKIKLKKRTAVNQLGKSYFFRTNFELDTLRFFFFFLKTCNTMTFRQLALTKRECKPVSAESSDWGKKMNTNYPRKHNERNYSEKWKKDYSFWPSLAVTQLCKAQWGGGGSEWLKQPLGNPLSISVCTKQLSIWNSKSLLMIETQLGYLQDWIMVSGRSVLELSHELMLTDSFRHTQAYINEHWAVLTARWQACRVLW